MKKVFKNFLKIFFSFLISYLFLYFVFRKIDIKEVLFYIKEVKGFWILFFVFVSFLIYFLKGLRFVLLNSAIKNITIRDIYFFTKSLLIGFMLNNFLPFRTGDVCRAVILSKNYNLKKSYIIGAVILERLFDIFSIFTLFLIFFLFNKIEISSFFKKFSKIGLFIVGLIFLLLMYFKKYKAVFFRKINSFFHIKFLKKVNFTFNSILNGFSILNQKNKFLKFYVFSLFIWLLEGISYFFIGKAVGLNIGILNFIFVMIIVCFFSMIPSGPFFLGTFEAGVIFAFEKFLIDKEQAAVFAIILHFLQIILVGSLGVLFLFKLKFNMFELFYKKELDHTEE